MENMQSNAAMTNNDLTTPGSANTTPLKVSLLIIVINIEFKIIVNKE